MSNKTKVTDDATRAHGFQRSLEPDKIIGSANPSGELMYLMKW